MKSLARIHTESAGRYMRQLCSHFAHKIPASYTETEGRIEFPFGVCSITAREAELVLLADAEAEEELRRLEDVIARHLVRFAWREEPEIVWAPAQ